MAPPGPTASVSGVVFNLTGGGSPLAGATVSSTPGAGSNVTTNGLGQYTLTIPAEQVVSVTVSKAGFASHPVNLKASAGNAEGLTLSLLPIGVTQNVAAASGGQVMDPVSRTAVTLPAGFVSSSSTAQVQVTGLDPTTVQSMAMPGTISALNLFNASGNLDPISVAEVTVGDAAGNGYALAKTIHLELPIPASRVAELLPGSALQCFRYDPTDGLWKAFAYGTVASSGIGGVPVVKVDVDHLSWYAAGLLDGTPACVSGIVTAGGTPIPNVNVQAFPGGLTTTNSLGQYEVDAAPHAAIQLVATRVAGGAITTAGASAQSDTIGNPCVQRNLALQSGPAQSYIVEAQLIRGRDAATIIRDEATVRIRVNTSPTFPAYNNAVVKLNGGGTVTTLPSIGNGYYGVIGGVSGSLSLQRGSSYELDLDFDGDGAMDASATVLMPGGMRILSPSNDAIVDSVFAAEWSDDASSFTGYDAIYVGSFEPLTFPIPPQVFVTGWPAGTVTVGDRTAIGDPALHLPNDPLPTGQYYFHLWAANGPIRYALPDTTLFGTPNITGPGVTGWFSAISMADSIKIGSIIITP